MVKYQTVVLLILDCVCMTHRSSCFSSLTLTSGIVAPSYWNRSNCTWKGCRILSNLVLVAGHLFRQEKKLSSASAINEVRCVNLLLPSLFTAKMFYNLTAWEPKSVPFRQFPVDFKQNFFLTGTFKAGPCIQLISSIPNSCFVFWGFFFLGRKLNLCWSPTRSNGSLQLFLLLLLSHMQLLY